MTTVTSKDGTSIAYEKIGKGPVIILITGAFMDHSDHIPLAKALARDFTVINYDRRGHGESSDTKPYAIERELEDIDALIQANGGSAFLYGTSSGAALAFEAASYGLNAKKIVLYEPPYSVDHNGLRNPTAETLKEIVDAVAEDRRGDAVKLFVTELVGLPAEAAAGMEQSPAWPSLKEVAPTVVHDATIAAAEGDYLIPYTRMRTLKTPTLVIGGSESWDWIRATAKEVAQTIPEAEYLTLEGQDHAAKAEVVAPVLVKFLKNKE